MFDLIIKDVKDRLKGNKARANARWGFVSPPEGTGKVVWIYAGKSRDSVMLAAALLAAIRHKRKDIKLVLTYEQEYQDILVQHLAGLEKIGFGYSCANHKSAIKRMINRLSPLGVIFVSEELPDKFMAELASQEIKHLIGFQNTGAIPPGLEAVYPRQFPENIERLEKAPAVANEFEAMTRIVQAQVDKQLGALLCGDKISYLFLFHAPDFKTACKMLQLWQGSKLSSHSLLGFTVDESYGQGKAALFEAVEESGFLPVLLSKWNKQSLSVNQVIISDEARWFPALAASSLAIHLTNSSLYAFWQIMSSGAAISYSEKAQHVNHDDVYDHLDQVSVDDLLTHWEMLEENQFMTRQKGDSARKEFWRARRESEQSIEELLQRVYDW